jgi:hypothetical protein
MENQPESTSITLRKRCLHCLTTRVGLLAVAFSFLQGKHYVASMVPNPSKAMYYVVRLCQEATSLLRYSPLLWKPEQYPHRDVVILCLMEGQPDAAHHLNIANSPVTRTDAGRALLILGMNIPKFSIPGRTRDPPILSLRSHTTTLQQVREVTFSYTGHAEPKDCGFCVVLVDTGEAVGMHLEGWNHYNDIIPLDTELEKWKHKDADNKTILGEMSSMVKLITIGASALVLYPQLLDLPTSAIEPSLWIFGS